jgi:hypothetical protein
MPRKTARLFGIERLHFYCGALPLNGAFMVRSAFARLQKKVETRRKRRQSERCGSKRNSQTSFIMAPDTDADTVDTLGWKLALPLGPKQLFDSRDSCHIEPAIAIAPTQNVIHTSAFIRRTRSRPVNGRIRKHYEMR